MPYDLVIKNGVLIDGSGLPRYPDVAVQHGRIASIGRIRERAREVIDADGMVVSPLTSRRSSTPRCRRTCSATGCATSRRSRSSRPCAC